MGDVRGEGRGAKEWVLVGEGAEGARAGSLWQNKEALGPLKETTIVPARARLGLVFRVFWRDTAVRASCDGGSVEKKQGKASFGRGRRSFARRQRSVCTFLRIS